MAENGAFLLHEIKYLVKSLVWNEYQIPYNSGKAEKLGVGIKITKWEAEKKAEW